MLGQALLPRSGLARIALTKNGPRRQLTIASRGARDDRDGVAQIGEATREITPNKPGAASDKDFHVSLRYGFEKAWLQVPRDDSG